MRLLTSFSCLGLCLTNFCLAADLNRQRIIIKFKPTSKQLLAAIGDPSLVRQQLMQPLSSSVQQQIQQLAGVTIRDVSPLALGGRIIKPDHQLSQAEFNQLLAKIRSLANIEYAVIDQTVMPTGLLNAKQWDMANQSTSLGNYTGNNFTGNNGIINTSIFNNYGTGVIVAVIDTGYIPHPNFLAQLQPTNSLTSNSYGYQFISDCASAHDCATNPSGAPVPNGLDLGDYDSTYNSSWHGTHVTGSIIANGSTTLINGLPGVAGGAPAAKVIPIRALGSGGGFSSDIINGMLWAAGFPVGSLPINPYPAKVINLSLGGNYSCDSSYQEAINLLTNAGVTVVAAAGNDGVDTSKFTPASCNGVISVAASGPTSKLAYYSNYGNVTIVAAGGDSSYANGTIYSSYCSDS